MTDEKQGTPETPSAQAVRKAERPPEPWLRGTHSDLEPVARAVLHSLEMAREDIEKWCGGLDDAAMLAKPCGLSSPASQLRHIAGSLDRFTTYAEGRSLSAEQLSALVAEKNPPVGKDAVLREFVERLELTEQWLVSRCLLPLESPLKIGRKGLPTTVGGLLVHMAEHTQRHVGQAITTIKAVTATCV